MMRIRPILLTVAILEYFKSHYIFESVIQLVKCHTHLSYYEDVHSALLPSYFLHQMTLISREVYEQLNCFRKEEMSGFSWNCPTFVYSFPVFHSCAAGLSWAFSLTIKDLFMWYQLLFLTAFLKIVKNSKLSPLLVRPINQPLKPQRIAPKAQMGLSMRFMESSFDLSLQVGSMSEFRYYFLFWMWSSYF